LVVFDFRYSTRAALGVNGLIRAEMLAAGIKGKRSTHRRPNSARNAKLIKRKAKDFMRRRRQKINSK